MMATGDEESGALVTFLRPLVPVVTQLGVLVVGLALNSTLLIVIGVVVFVAALLPSLPLPGSLVAYRRSVGQALGELTAARRAGVVARDARLAAQAQAMEELFVPPNVASVHAEITGVNPAPDASLGLVAAIERRFAQQRTIDRLLQGLGDGAPTPRESAYVADVRRLLAMRTEDYRATVTDSQLALTQALARLGDLKPPKRAAAAHAEFAAMVKRQWIAIDTLAAAVLSGNEPAAVDAARAVDACVEETKQSQARLQQATTPRSWPVTWRRVTPSPQ